MVPQGFATPPTPLHPEGGAPATPQGRGFPEGAPGPTRIWGAKVSQKRDFKMSRMGELLSTQRKCGNFRIFAPPGTPLRGAPRGARKPGHFLYPDPPKKAPQGPPRP